MSTNVHWNPPSVSASDPRGLPARHIAYLRTLAGGSVQALITRQQHDVAGRAVAQYDPRLPIPDTTSVYALNGQALTTRNVDSGESSNLPGLAGEPRQTWDAHNNHRRLTHDNQLRVVAIEENAVPGVETFIYASATADATHNLRGQLITQTDSSGHIELSSYAMTGQARSETRTFADGKSYSSHQLFSPIGALVQSTDAGGHCQQSSYDVAGQLTQVQLQLNGKDWQPVFNDAQYNAAGQITEQRTANGVTSRWLYREADGRLHRHCAQSASQPAVLDDEYTYDRVGNILGILDRTYTPTFFRNQQVDGQRTFAYDSLYRLIRATGHDDAPPADNPGRPQPTDPNDRRNYVQTYAYDDGNNLNSLSHVRDGASYTRKMAIDSASNRGVRWKPGDPAPDFDQLFDRAGNILALQPGQPILWNSYNQLESVTLAEHASGPHDTEHYRYSQGARVYKRHETHTTKLSHFHEVCYVGSLEIRNKDNGEELHLITVSAGVGKVTCLHWVAGKPAGIAADQMRYSLEDHLASSVIELDQSAQLISSEGYYPFGGTAKMAARSLIEVDYKFVRYSGKETDVSGLIHYSARYYAPWLQRWISADPAGDVDGPNRYAFVGNHPLRYVDPAGATRAEATIMLYAAFLGQVSGYAEQTNAQLHNIIHQKGFFSALAANLVVESVKGPIGYEAGLIGGAQIDMAIPHALTLPPHLTTGGLIGGNIGGDTSGAMADVPMNAVGLTGAGMIPKTSQMSVSAIDHALGIKTAVGDIRNFSDFMDERGTPALDKVLNPEFMMNRVMASWISIIPGTLKMFASAIEVEDIKNRLDPVKVGKIETMLDDWQSALDQRSAWMEQAFDAMGKDTLFPGDLMPNVNPTTSKEMLAPVTRQGLRQQTAATRYEIAHAQRGLAAYKEMGTTDNQYLRRKAHPPKQSSGNWFTRSA